MKQFEIPELKVKSFCAADILTASSTTKSTTASTIAPTIAPTYPPTPSTEAPTQPTDPSGGGDITTPPDYF